MHDLTKQAPPRARNSSTPKRLQHLQRRRRPAGLNDDDAEVQCEALRLLRLLFAAAATAIVTAAVDGMGAGVVTNTVYWYPKPLEGRMGPFGGPGCPAGQPLGGCVGASKSAVTSTENWPGGEKLTTWCLFVLDLAARLPGRRSAGRRHNLSCGNLSDIECRHPISCLIGFCL